MVQRLFVRPRASLALLICLVGMPIWAGAQGFVQPPRVDSRVEALLLAAQPGVYLVRGGRLAPADDRVGASVFVQADIDRGIAGSMRATLAIGALAPQAWTMVVEVAPATGAEPARGTPPARLSATGQPGRVREVRDLSLTPGSYRVSVALLHGTNGDIVATVARRTLAVPQLSAGSLAASPVVIGEAATSSDGLPVAEPFRFGPSSLTPAVLNRFGQGDRLHLALRLFGWKGDEAARPDLIVEYVFQQQVGPRYRFFNKTQPQEVNAVSLGKGFDGSKGEVTAGMSIPLAAFPPGAFQVEVRVRDRRTNASTVQRAEFVVTPS